MLHSGIVPARVERPVTGFMGSSDVATGQPDLAYELVVAGRSSQPDQGRKLALFDVQSRIPDDFSLQGVDQLVISDGKIHDDPGRLAAIRRWMHAGGTLWIMLDQVDPQAVERIVGDDFRCHAVDRVGLTTVRIEAKRTDGGVDAVEFEHEQPVELVRVVLAESNIRIVHTVNGWPAAFWKPCGAGQLLVTTLGARGWMRPRRAEDSETNLDERLSRPPRRPQELAPHSQAPSTYVILAPLVATSEIIFPGCSRPAHFDHRCLRGASCGIRRLLDSSPRANCRAFGRLRRGDHGAGNLAVPQKRTRTSRLVGSRALHRGSGRFARDWRTESARHSSDFGRRRFRTGRFRYRRCPLRGAAAFYRPEAGSWDIATTRGGHLMPDMTGQEGTTRRLVWSDLDAWSWQNLTQTSPHRTARFDQAQTLPDRIEARATFGPDGLAGRLSTPATLVPADAILATRSGQLGVVLSADGTFRALPKAY